MKITIAIETTKDEMPYKKDGTNIPLTGEVLRSRRKDMGLTILELAEKTELHRNTLGSIEIGDGLNDTKLSNIMKIANALECDLIIEIKPYEMRIQ